MYLFFVFLFFLLILIYKKWIQIYINTKCVSQEMDTNSKVKLQVWLPESLDTKFRELIQQKYNKFERGILSYEAEQALRHWLSLHTNAQNGMNRANKPNPTPKVQSIFFKIKDFLLTKYYYELLPGQQIPTVHLRRAIQNVRGSDERTILKWIKVFHKNGLIKPVTSATWEIL